MLNFVPDKHTGALAQPKRPIILSNLELDPRPGGCSSSKEELPTNPQSPPTLPPHPPAKGRNSTRDVHAQMEWSHLRRENQGQLLIEAGETAVECGASSVTHTKVFTSSWSSRRELPQKVYYSTKKNKQNRKTLSKIPECTIVYSCLLKVWKGMEIRRSWSRQDGANILGRAASPNMEQVFAHFGTS